MKQHWFRITFESKIVDDNGTTEFTVKAKNYAEAEKKALSRFNKKETLNCIIVIEKLNKENKHVR
jgi:hypothetical protein